MKLLNRFLVSLLICCYFTGCKARTTFGTDYLKLEEIIPMPDVNGRIDHLDINLKEQIVYVGAMGNNTLEVADLRNGRIIHSIRGLDEPQGVGFIPQTHEIFVANGGSGDCYFYNASNFEKTGTIHLTSDADDVRYDSSQRKIYVGYRTGGIAIIDANTHKQIAEVKLPVHPESFQIDSKLNLLFVNLPDANMVGVVDLKQMKLVGEWEKDFPTANFPMAIDMSHQRVFVGYRHPAKLIVVDSKTGKEISANTMVGDADDLYYDNTTANIFVSGGGGYMNIFHQEDQDTYKQIANISTLNGARTSLLIPELRLFVLASRAAGGKNASLQLYRITQ
jgi:hypothetical protein